MKNIAPWLWNLCFALNCLLLFWAAAGATLEVPQWLQVAGRMHPLVLHFPIALIVVAAIAALWHWPKTIADHLLLAAALSATVSALFGLLLSIEPGYDPEVLWLHRWSGTAVAVLLAIWYAFRQFFSASAGRLWAIAALSLVVLVVAGHEGGEITHGKNFITAPLQPATAAAGIPLEDALVYEHLVKPVLEAKCFSCHQPGKAKGELVMTTPELLLKGGKNGPLWDLSRPDLGLLMQRIHLPLEEKAHMPPKGKPQLTAEEMAILYHWIKKGADFKLKVAQLPEQDSLRQWAVQRLQPATEHYDFGPADESTIRKLTNNYRVIVPLAAQSPALSVSFYGVSVFKESDIRDLQPLKTQIVQMYLQKMPVTDALLPDVAAFTALRKLNLSETQITGATLQALAPLKKLRHLTLSGTVVKGSHLSVLDQLPELRELYLAQTSVSDQEIEALRQKMPLLKIEKGFSGDTIRAQLNAPVIEGPQQLFATATKVRLKNFIKGAVVRYTLDGTDPDSLQAAISTGDSILIEKTCELRAKAWLPGWISSPVSSRQFYKTGTPPDSVALVVPPNPDYKSTGPRALTDQKIGDTDFRSGKWLGFRESPMEAWMYYRTPIRISSVSVSTLVSIGSYIMPAKEVQIWGGDHPKNIVLLKKIIPVQPVSLQGMEGRMGIQCNFDQRSLKVLKVIVKPLPVLPSWHPGKGEKAWVFIDEVFVN